VAFSTSGLSRNVLGAIATARHRGLRTLGISGKTGLNCDVDIRIPSTSTARIQECTLVLIHALCESLEFHVEHGTIAADLPNIRARTILEPHA
jgi:hypothetical protein